MAILVLIRHGQSQWNLENRFTGWMDIPLTERGRKDAARTARALSDLQFDAAFTSVLSRAVETLDIILRELKQERIPIAKDQALNERHYGDLQGLNKAEMAQKYGQEQVTLWRRSYDTRPPNGESIADCVARVTPYFEREILPLVRVGKNALVVAHGNSIRPMLRFLDHLDDETTATIEIGLCIPYVYTFDGDQVVKRDVRVVPGVITKGASQTDMTVSEGRV